jgi:hypothetical protein
LESGLIWDDGAGYSGEELTVIRQLQNTMTAEHGWQ